MTINNLKISGVVLETWALGGSGDTGEGYFGSSLTKAGLKAALVPAHWMRYSDRRRHGGDH